MNESQYTNLVFSLIGVAGIVLALWVMYPRYAIDKFRQEMFKVRDDLFDDAAGGV
jgi:hypothetical protein